MVGIPNIVRHVAFKFTRLIQDFKTSILRDKAVDLVGFIVKDHFHHIIPIGRDFLRLLQGVSRIPEFEHIWKLILQEPKSLHVDFINVEQMWAIPTPREFITSLLTPDMEFKLLHILRSTPSFFHYTLLERFRARFIPTPGSESLYSDLIRFTCTVVHPTNAELRSGVAKRWEVIRTILSQIRTTKGAQDAKMVLFYDWMMYNHATDNFMNLEPTILLIVNSLHNSDPYGPMPQLSSNLIEYLFYLVKLYSPIYQPRFKLNVRLAMRVLIEKTVIM